MISKSLAAAVLLAFTAIHTVHAAPAESAPATAGLRTNGVLVVLPAIGEVKHINDQAVVQFSVEETHEDKAVAASRANDKMKRGMDLLRKADPQAVLKTERYYTYPVYPDPVPVRTNGSATAQAAPRVPVGWRVGQTLRLTTSNITALQKTVATAQSLLALTNIRFGLTPETARKLEAERISATYADLDMRVRAVAASMGRTASDAVVEVLDFEGTGRYAEQQVVAYATNVRAPGAPPAPPAPLVEEPSFEPGETTLQMRAVGKVRFQ